MLGSESLLRKNTLFSRLSDEALAVVQQKLKTHALKKGEVIFKQGDPGNELLIVQEGKIAIYAPSGSDPAEGQAIRIFQPGDMLGEMAVVDEKPRSLSARAEEDSVVLGLHASDFHAALHANPALSLSVMAGLSDRIRYTTDFLTEVRTWVGKMNDGNYQEASGSTAKQYRDPTLATLAAEFAQMASQVKEREDTLKREVARLRIEIDDSKRKEEVQQIVDSDYYRQLKEKMKAIRAQNQGDK